MKFLASVYSTVVAITIVPALVLVFAFNGAMVSTLACGIVAMLIGLAWAHAHCRSSAEQREALLEQLEDLSSTSVEDYGPIEGDDPEFSELLNRVIARVTERVQELESATHTLRAVGEKLAQSQDVLQNWTDGHSLKTAEIEHTLDQLQTGLAAGQRRFEELCVARASHNGALESASIGEQAVNEVENFEAEAQRRLATLLQDREALDDGSKALEEIVKIVLGVAAQTQLVSLNVATETALENRPNGVSALSEEMEHLAKNADRAAARVHEVVACASDQYQRIERSIHSLGSFTRDHTVTTRRLAERLQESDEGLEALRSQAREQLALSRKVLDTLENARAASEQGAERLQKLAQFQEQLRSEVVDVSGEGIDPSGTEA